MNKILLLISIILILVAYIRIILIYLKTKNIKINDLTGFDLAKELTSNYDEINIVESNSVNISKYNLKRRIIRFTNKDYNSNDIFTLTKSSFLSSYSLLHLNKDKNINLLSNILPNIDYLNKSSIPSLIISLLANSKGDAKIAILLLLIFLVYQYLINEINNNSIELTNKDINKILSKKDYLLVTKTRNTYLFLNKISFITTLILLLREILIIIY